MIPSFTLLPRDNFLTFTLVLTLSISINLRLSSSSQLNASPLARNAQVSFFTDYDMSGQFRPISGSIGLVQAIIEGIGAQKF